MANVSPGVYTKIIDLSEYVQNVPSTIAFLPIICERGQDNELIFTNSRDFYIDFGEPNITYVGKDFGQGPYIADSFFKESDSMYIVRCLPVDADFSVLRMYAEGLGDTTCLIYVDSSVGMNTHNELLTKINDAESLLIFYGVGRGEWYDNFQIKLSQHLNTYKEGVYVLDIYQRQSEDNPENGEPQYEIISSFEVSFDPKKLDSAGESMFIADVVNKYSRFIKCYANDENCTAAVALTGTDFGAPFESDPVNLQNGSCGSLFSGGLVDPTKAIQILSKAYKGDLEKTTTSGGSILKDVLDTDFYYFSIILDGGYPTDVKTQGLYSMVLARKDCVGIIDNGDNSTVADALAARGTDHNYNTRYLALYECYSKIYDTWIGKDIWISPVYHMANIIPYTDNVSELWYAPAGFNRATIASIKELRYSPVLGERDQLYLAQINPIVKFNVGYTVWGQLTTQKRPTALQDLSIMRLVLYIKRALEQFCKYYIFEQNDEPTWSAISSEITRFLKQVQNRRGLYSFSVDVGADEYEIKAKQVHCNVILQPVRTVEQILLNFYIM